MYTDGVNETMDARRSQYGEERIGTVLEELRGSPAEKIIEDVLRDVEEFEDGQLQQDDRTMLVLQMKQDRSVQMTDDCTD